MPVSPVMRRKLLLGFGFSLSVLFIYLTFRKIEFVKVWQELGQIHYGWMIAAVFIQFVGFWGMTLRSKLLLQPLHDYPVFRVFKSTFVSFTGNNIFPMRAGEVLRIDYLARHGHVPHSSILAVIFVERLLDMLFLMTLFFGIVPLFMTNKNISTNSLYIPAVVVVVSLVLILGMSRFPFHALVLFRRMTSIFGQRISHFVMEKLELFVHGLSALQSLGRVVFVLVGTGIFWGMNNVAIFFWLKAFQLHSLPWYTPMVLQTFVAFGAALPSAPGFVGTYHYFLKASLMLMGVSATQGDSFALVAHAFNIIPLTVFGLLLLLPDYLQSPQSFQAPGAEYLSVSSSIKPEQNESK